MLPETKKENRIDLSEKKPKVNHYFIVMSGRFKVAKYITLCVLVVFLLTSVILFRNEITVENLRYLLKDFEVGDNVSLGGGDTITFDSDVQVNLALYKGDLVVAGSTYFYLCDLQGNKRLNESSMYSNPVVLTGDKYLLVYGLSEYTYSIYNTFSKLHTETFDYPISGAAVSDNGMYAIVSRSAKYRSVVYLYNDNFECIGVVSKDKYVMDVQFNKDGTEILITSLYSKNGVFCTEIANYTPFSESHKATLEVENAMPLKTGYNSDGGYSVVYDKKIDFYGSDAVLLSTYTFDPGVVPLTMSITKDYTMIAYNENIVGDDIKVLVFDKTGALVRLSDVDGQPKKIKQLNDYVYLLFNGEVCRIKISTGDIKYFEIELNPIDLLVVDDEKALACYINHTSKLVFE